MREFAQLLENLLYTSSRNRKITLLADYFRHTPDPDRGYALAALTGDLSFQHLKASVFKEALLGQVDPVLFELSYDYVGDLAETIALMWDGPSLKGERKTTSLSEWVKKREQIKKEDLISVIKQDFNHATSTERWAMIKLATGGLRIGVSARLAKTALAEYSGKPLERIEAVWHGLSLPYEELFQWLDGDLFEPEIKAEEVFHPMMLSHPIDEEKDFSECSPADFSAEWKWDGIRVQLGFNHEHQHVYSRTGDDISGAFPDLVESLEGNAVLDGELLVGHGGEALPFNDLQQRLNRKRVVKKHLVEYPAFVRVYDVLFLNGEDLRALSWEERRQRLEKWMKQHPQSRLHLSKVLPFNSWEELKNLREKGVDEEGHEGLMLKNRSSPYLMGRKKGHWYKWKRDPRVVDAVMMYAQRGHGRRSSYYSDFTFGVWKDETQTELVPIGKAYSGFTDEEMRELDKWVLKNTLKRFGPVSEVEREIVFEVAFDSAHKSNRHKSGIALRFPRIHRIRWDKPIHEVLEIQSVRQEFLGEPKRVL